MPLSKAQIQEARPQTKEVEIPELAHIGDGKVLLGIMPALKLTGIMRKLREQGEEIDNLDLKHPIEFLAATLLDAETNELAFTEDELMALAEQTLSMETIEKLFMASYDLHGMTKDAAEGLEKNLPETPGADSGGSSPGSSDTLIPTDS